MDASFFVRIRAGGRQPGTVLVDVVSATDDMVTARVPRPVEDGSPTAFARWSEEIVAAAPGVVERLLAHFGVVPSHPLLIEVADRSLQGLAWEELSKFYPFGHLWGSPFRPVIRYTSTLADLALVPAALPVDVLIAEAEGWTTPSDPVVPRPLQHFRTVHATRFDVEGMGRIAASAAVDILHLRLAAAPAAAGLGGQREEPATVAAGLAAGLRKNRHLPRLAIIESPTGGSAARRELGYLLHAYGRSTVIVAGDESEFNYDRFYENLTHDQPMDIAFQGASKTNRNMLLMAKGGAELLRLSGSEEVLRQRTLEGLSRVRTSLESVTQWQSIAPAHEADEAERSFRAAESSLAAVESMTYRYFAESAGMEPLITATGQAAQGLAIAPSEPLPARVVNTWITTDGGAKPPGNVLRTGATYTLLVSVGIPSSRSIVEHPVSLPEQELAPHYRDGTLPLRVVLFSTDFGLDVTERILLVPEPPAGATPVSFPVTAPTSPGPARLRVAIYHANNLVQSIMITATVGEGRGGLAGVVEWALSANVTDVDRLGDKAVNLLVNDGPAGSHLLGVVGDDFTAQFEMDAGELERSADEARRTLQWVCGDPDKKEKYRFEPDNRSAGADFREHLSGMAELGYDLYTSLVIDREDAFETNLSTALARPVTIQAARMRSCKFVFPWALVYDHPVVPSRHNEVCPDFLAVLQRRPLVDDLMRHDCFVRGCAHREDTNIVCPSGFWGFRHVIEQPLSTVDKNAITGDALDHITVDGNRPVEMFNAYSRNLTLSEDHCRELQVLPSVRSTADFDLLRIGHGLKRTDLDIVYFYCHGGNRRGKAWLGVGARPPEELYATNLKAWAVRWLTQHPFVFINGCDTVGMLPHDLLTFNEVLVWCKAAGVMGSEIRIPETLGRAFGRRFLKEFAAGDEVGQLVRRLRLELLTGFNPLGLAYTPYCLAKLHIARAST